MDRFKNRLKQIPESIQQRRNEIINGLPYSSDGLQVPVFSVLTRDAIGELRGIHERMPMILRREDVESWIKPDGNPQEVSRRALTEMCFEKAV